MKNVFDSIIIGSGPAGLTAAIYNLRADMKTVVVSGNQPGGQLTITTFVENYPGFPNGIGGTKLMMDMQQQVKNLGGEIKIGMVRIVRKTDNGIFEVVLADGEIMKTQTVIIATGAQAKWLGLKGERDLIGRGISGCATCDGMFFRDKVVAVVGGGDVACTDAEFLTKFASKLYMIHRRRQLRAQIPQQKKVLVNPKIEFLWDSEVKEIIGSEKLEKIRVVNGTTGEERILETDGLFVAIGHDPATQFVEGLVELKESGHVITGKNSEYVTQTSVPGVFAAGDCVDDWYRQAIIAAGEGAKAGLDAERWIDNQKKRREGGNRSRNNQIKIKLQLRH